MVQILHLGNSVYAQKRSCIGKAVIYLKQWRNVVWDALKAAKICFLGRSKTKRQTRDSWCQFKTMLNHNWVNWSRGSKHALNRSSSEIFGSCPLKTHPKAEDRNKSMSTKLQKEVNSLRLAQRNDSCLEGLVNQKSKPQSSIWRRHSDMGLLGPECTYWWHAVHEVAWRGEHWNTETIFSTSWTRRDIFGATSQFENQWRSFCFSKEMGQGKT